MSAYDDQFEAAGQKYNVDPRLLKTVFRIESGGNPNAPDSYQGAQGGMQMLPQTAAAMGASDPHDMTQAIPAAARYLAEGLDATGTPQGALAYYHGGPDRAQWGPKTAAYVAKGQATYPTVNVGNQPVAQKQQDDPDLAAGQAAFQTMTGAGAGAAPKATEAKAPIDPDEAAGMAAFQTMTANPKPEAAAAPNPNAGLNEYGITDDPQQFNNQKPGIAIAPNSSFPKTTDEARALLAEKPGYTASNILPMRVKNDANGQADPSLGVELDPGPLRGVGNALLDLVDGPRTGTVTPAATQLLANVAMGGGLTRSVARGTGEAIADTAAYGAPKAELYAKNRLTGDAAPALAQQGATNALTGDASAAEPAKGTAPVGSDTGSTPGPRSVGAAASSATESDLTPQQERAYRSTAEGQKLLESQPIGQADARSYVPGVNPNAAEIEQTVNTARDLKAAGLKYPSVSQDARETADANNLARQRYFEGIAGSKVDLQNAEAARSAQGKADLDTAWTDKKPVDAAPVLQSINETLAGPDGKIDPVRDALTKARSALMDGDGNLETDPERLYGARKQISFLLSKKNIAANPAYGDETVVGALRDIQRQLDDVIEGGASGFRQYLDNYTKSSRHLDEMEAMQGFEKRLYDTQNRMTYSNVQRMMRQIVDGRQGGGINPLQSIRDETMQKLWMLRDDLRRSASAQELARTPGGSDSAQNFIDLARLGGSAVTHAGANWLLGPGIGSVAVGAVKGAASPIMKGMSDRKGIRRGMDLLHPPTPLRNPLQEP